MLSTRTRTRRAHAECAHWPAVIQSMCIEVRIPQVSIVDVSHKCTALRYKIHSVSIVTIIMMCAMPVELSI